MMDSRKTTGSFTIDGDEMKYTAKINANENNNTWGLIRSKILVSQWHSIVIPAGFLVGLVAGTVVGIVDVGFGPCGRGKAIANRHHR